MSSEVGIFGGTFDPPHIGHLAAAQRCQQALGLERVLFVVANDPWQKSPNRQVSPASDRVAMVASLIEGAVGLEVCEREVERGGESYTIETVEALEKDEGVVDPWVIVGSDLALTLDSWERAGELRDRVRIAVMSRPGSPLSLPAGWRAVALISDDLDISSSQIRHRVATGQEIDEFVPLGVVHDITSRNLYA